MSGLNRLQAEIRAYKINTVVLLIFQDTAMRQTTLFILEAHPVRVAMSAFCVCLHVQITTQSANNHHAK